MYKIKNLMPGLLPIPLERGAITLRPSQSFDLDIPCSRHWIKTNPELQMFFDKNLITLVCDSEVTGLPTTDLTRPARKNIPGVISTPPVLPTPTPPVVTSSVPEVVTAFVPAPIPPLPKIKTVENIGTVTIEDPDSKATTQLSDRAIAELPLETYMSTQHTKISKTQLLQMRLAPLQEAASNLGIDTSDKTRKILIREILEAQ